MQRGVELRTQVHLKKRRNSGRCVPAPPPQPLHFTCQLAYRRIAGEIIILIAVSVRTRHHACPKARDEATRALWRNRGKMIIVISRWCTRHFAYVRFASRKTLAVAATTPRTSEHWIRSAAQRTRDGRRTRIRTRWSIEKYPNKWCIYIQ